MEHLLYKKIKGEVIVGDGIIVKPPLAIKWLDQTKASNCIIYDLKRMKQSDIEAAGLSAIKVAFDEREREIAVKNIQVIRRY